MEYSFIKWDLFDTYVNVLYYRLKDMQFDTIVGVGRGGLIPATILSYKLGINDLQNIAINTRHSDNIEIYQIPQNLKGKVLVVDDINDTGVTFETIKKLLDVDITFASLIKRYNTKFDNIYAHLATNDDWYVFPWDK